MSKAIATAPDKPTKYETLTDTEKAERKLEEAKFIADKPLLDWESEMQDTDNEIPRYVEDIIDALDAPTRAKVNKRTLDKYDHKKQVRARKPKGV